MKIVLVLVFLACLSAFSESTKYDSVVYKLKEIEKNHSNFAKVFSIGTNDDNIEILAMRISTNPLISDPTKISHVIVSTHHGNEGKATDFAFAFIERILERFSGWELYSKDFDTEWIIIPVLNISGYNISSRYEHGIDPNRDYPGPCISEPGGKLKSIRVLMAYLNSRIITGTVTVHGYIGSLTYPWGVSTTNTHTLDHNFYTEVTSKAAKFNNYQYGTSTDIIYPADGTYEDYVYWKHGIWSLLVELRSGSQTDIDETVKAVETFFDNINSSPSTKNQMTGYCTREKPKDLQIE